MLSIDEAIKHCLEVAEENDLAAGTHEILAENNHNAYERLTAETNSSRCAECAADHRQLAEWLMELKDLREENKVLIQKCDRLIKEKGELLSKVSGGDVLRICQLEEQLKNCKEEYANLNKISYGYYKELKEAKRLLKMAVEDIHDILTSQRKITNNTLCHKCSYYLNCTCKDICETRCDLKQWRYGAEALKLIGENNDEP